jgi:WXG100 family type VII secretion target
MSSGGFVSTTILGMTQAQNAMQEMVAEINSASQALEDQQSTLAANWTGEASSQFGTALSNFLADFGTINNALVAMMEALSQNTGIYVNAQETSSAMAAAFTNNPGGILTSSSMNGAIATDGLAGF